MEDEVKAIFGKLWPAHVSSLTKPMIACRKAFDGDLDMFLVLAVIGDRTCSQRHAHPDMTCDDFNSGEAGRTRSP